MRTYGECAPRLAKQEMLETRKNMFYRYRYLGREVVSIRYIWIEGYIFLQL